MVKQVKS